MATDAGKYLRGYVREFKASGDPWYGVKPSAYPSGQAVLALPVDGQIRAVLDSPEAAKPSDFEASQALQALRGQLLRRKLPFSAEDIAELAALAGSTFHRYYGPEKAILAAIERYHEAQPLPRDASVALQQVLNLVRTQGHDTKENRHAVTRLEALLGLSGDLPLSPGEVWSDAVLTDLDAASVEKRSAWASLLSHCQSASAGKPASKWAKEAEAILNVVGIDEFVAVLPSWLPLVDKNTRIIDAHADILKGLAWCSSLVESRDLARALSALAISSYRKIPQVGPRLVKVGNAAVWALGAMPGRDAIGQLAYLKVKVKFGTAQKEIDKALAAAAEREGLPRDELEEMAVPAYGLTDVGLREEPIGDYIARLAVTGLGKTELIWLKPDGKPQKSVPVAVKSDFPEDLKDLKAAAKDIEKMLPAQRDRIDTLYLDRKTWSLATWRERYLDHPLVGVIARKLIWRFESGDSTRDAFWHDGRLVDREGRPFDANEAAVVSLWHPISESVETVLAWRRFLEAREIRQPFKQAHREVYLLTDAERNTHTYSNRFAAHVLKQHQFHALCAVRGWKNRLRLMVDDSYPPASKELPAWGLRAEFWIEGAGDEYGRDTTESGAYLYLATDQVRFYRIDAVENFAHAGGGGYGGGRWGGHAPPEPLPLEEVPPLALSEVMRDVDLFVGVASVGNDPNWADGGPEGRYRDYWQSYGFGDLSATAQTRKAVLERLIPRLRIADRCTFSDRFLLVRGNLRSYKIHLGSGNIHMEPNDEYLCIVPKSGDAAVAGEKLYLPFEGDRTLSIVLSKAQLLAADDKIADPTITRQINRS